MLSELMERLHAPLEKPLAVGVEVICPRGYGIVAGYTGDGYEGGIYHGPPIPKTIFVLVELEDGLRVPFRAEQLQAVERVAT